MCGSGGIFWGVPLPILNNFRWYFYIKIYTQMRLTSTKSDTQKRHFRGHFGPLPTHFWPHNWPHNWPNKNQALVLHPLDAHARRHTHTHACIRTRTRYYIIIILIYYYIILYYYLFIYIIDYTCEASINGGG